MISRRFVHLLLNPRPERRLAEGDVLFVCADSRQFAAARRITAEG